MVGPVFLYIIERFIRFYRSFQEVKIMKVRCDGGCQGREVAFHFWLHCHFHFDKKYTSKRSCISNRTYRARCAGLLSPRTYSESLLHARGHYRCCEITVQFSERMRAITLIHNRYMSYVFLLSRSCEQAHHEIKLTCFESKGYYCVSNFLTG